ncbi:MFS transporter [Streptomyces sp. NPDC052051]|uniref:MFS transporter n=1 Tax=Streptomyces sp. NPDC052051 TaxID=3154649 RepID=UPI003439E13B
MRKARLHDRSSAGGPIPRIGWAARVREAGAPLAIRPYRLHFTARMLSWTGSAVAPIGLAFAVLHIGGGPGALGAVLAASVVPQILLLLVGGVVADRLPRDRVMVAVVGPGWALGWDALTFVASALLFSRISLKPKTVKVRTGFTADLREGWDDFRSRRWLWVMVCQAAVIVPVWLVGYQLLGPVYGQRVLGGAAPWGVVVSGFTAGLVAGAALALMWKPCQVGLVVCAGTGSMAVPLAAMAASVPLPVLVVATAVAGTGLAVSMTVWSSLVQERIPADRLGRTLSYSTLGQILPVPFGYLLAGPASHLFGLRTTLAAGALIITTAAVVPLAIAQVRGLGLAPETAKEADGAVSMARAER